MYPFEDDKLADGACPAGVRSFSRPFVCLIARLTCVCLMEPSSPDCSDSTRSFAPHQVARLGGGQILTVTRGMLVEEMAPSRGRLGSAYSTKMITHAVVVVAAASAVLD